MHSPSKQTSNQLINTYAIFLILERQRNFKLRELYRNKQVVDTLLPMISEESSDASPTTTNIPTTRKSSLRQAMKQKKNKCNASSISSMSTLPNFPPRYQALSNIITSDALMMQLRTTNTTSPPRSNRQRSPSSPYMEEYRNLDQGTKRFLNDTVKLLQDRYNEEVENNETKLEIPMRRSSSSTKRRTKLFVFRAEKKLSLIVD